jgi:hypothetical protein
MIEFSTFLPNFKRMIKPPSGIYFIYTFFFVLVIESNVLQLYIEKFIRIHNTCVGDLLVQISYFSFIVKSRNIIEVD